jgi:hypothetical protein
MITDHSFRPVLAGAGGPGYGTCAWLGSCGKPKSEHGASVKTVIRTLPRGLCSEREDHAGHEHTSTSLGTYWCTGDQNDREPGRSERRRVGA